MLGVSHPTIKEWLGKEGGRNLPPESEGAQNCAPDDSDNPPTIIGADGKQYPARKPKPTAKPLIMVDKPKDIKRVTKAVDVAKKIIPAIGR